MNMLLLVHETKSFFVRLQKNKFDLHVFMNTFNLIFQFQGTRLYKTDVMAII